MRHIEPIEYGSAEYLETLELRNRVMRIPGTGYPQGGFQLRKGIRHHRRL